MEFQNKATRIRLFDFSSVPMRAFHMSWFAFFLCFFAWFGIAPLMKVVREELHLTKEQIGWCIIGSVAITVVARLLIGWLCDKIGPRLAYTGFAAARIDSRDGHRLCRQLHLVSLVPHRDRRDRGFVRHHAIPHLRDVRPQLRRHGQCDDRGLGEPGRRRDAVRDAAGLRVLRGDRRPQRVPRAGGLRCSSPAFCVLSPAWPITF